LGNAFLSHINAVDGIIHVMRAFEDDAVIHHDDKPNPVADIEMITEELRIKDIAMMKGFREAHNKKRSSSATKSPAALKEWETELGCIDKFIGFMEDGKDIRNCMEDLVPKDIEYLNEYRLLTAKPVMFAINLSLRDYQRKKNKFLKPIYDWVQEHAKGSMMIPYCGTFEESIQDLDAAAVKEQEASEDGGSSALPKMIKNAFNMINLINFFTYGPDEVRSWIIRKGFLAPKAGSVIHNDFEKAFVMAEVIAFADLKELGSEQAVKDAGKWQQQGKTYEVKDGDCIVFKVGQIKK